MEKRGSVCVTWRRGRWSCGRSALALAALSAFFVFCARPADCQVSAPSAPFQSGRDVVLRPPAGGAARFRFLPDGQWIHYDRELLLGAALGETRAYSIEIDEGRGETNVAEYIIDKGRPQPPSVDPQGGLYRGPLSPAFGCERGSHAVWALVGPGSSPLSFTSYSPESRPLLAVPPEGVATYTLLAYAEDGAGNRSELRRFVYRIAEAGLPANTPAQDGSPVSPRPDGALALPRRVSSSGSIELSYDVPDGGEFLVAVNPSKIPSTLDEFVRVAPENGIAHFAIPCPYGWSGKLHIYFGLFSNGVAVFSPDGVDMELSYPPDDSPLIAAPGEPRLAADVLGRGSFIVFPSYDGEILFSLNGAAWAAYEGPLVVDAGLRDIDVSWRGEKEGGRRSETRSMRMELPSALSEAILLGVDDGAVVGEELTLTPSSPSIMRYELRTAEDDPPPEPGPSSPPVNDGLSLRCPPGEVRHYVLRYRVFADASDSSPASDGRILRCTIDRKPPDPPRPTAALPAYSNKALSLAFEPGELGSTVFASLSVDGADAPFAPVTGILEFPGSEKGSVAYVVRAYRVDEAGNRSAEMDRISLVIDHSSVYAADDASDDGDGSPSRPYRNFDAALAAAIAEGKRSINVRGKLVSTKAVVATAPIDIIGGFGAGWTRDRSVRAQLRVESPASAPAFSSRGVAMTLRNISFSFPSPGPATAASAGSTALFDVAKGSLTLENCTIQAGSAGDLVIAHAASSSVEIARSSVTIDRAMSCAIARAEESNVEFRDSVITARPGTRAFAAFDLEGGSLSITGALIESSADLALRLLSLKDAKLVMDRSLVRVDSGSGYLRLGSFSEVEGELRNSRFSVSWKGDGLLFETSRTSPAFRHVTITAESLRGKLGFFGADGEAPEIWNSVLSCASGGGVMLACGSAPPAGRLVADCVWGFDTLVSTKGARIVSLDALNALNRGSAAFAKTRHISESPSKTFAAPVKNLSSLASGSACVDAAYPLQGEAYSTDFSGAPRPAPGGAGLPDIGAEELGG
jgi:hypothetical protein